MKNYSKCQCGRKPLYYIEIKIIGDENILFDSVICEDCIKKFQKIDENLK